MAEDYAVKPALFLDLDGTIRTGKTSRFINKVEDITLFEDVESILWEYRDRGYLVFGVTNQGGVAFGYKSLQQVQEEIDATLALFTRNPFDDVKASVLHPEGTQAPFNHRSLLRKPAYGMLAVYEAEYFKQRIVLDWEESLFVGDRLQDEACARAAGIRFEQAEVFFKRGSSPGVD